MHRARTRTLVVLTGALLCLSAAAEPEPAPETKPASESDAGEPPVISDEKRTLILEVLEAGGSDQMMKQVTQVYLAQLRPAYRNMVLEVMKTEEDLTDEERALLMARLEDFDRFAERFRELLPERLDFVALRNEVYVPLYARTFDEQQLREIAAFYRSDTGQKVLAVMPRMMEEGMAATFRKVQPEILAVVGEILAEQRGEAPSDAAE
jgi:hypothetical protein